MGFSWSLSTQYQQWQRIATDLHEFAPTLQSHWPLKCSLQPRPQNRIESMRATFCSRNTWLKLPPPEAPETVTVSVVTDIDKWSAFSLPEILAPTPETDRRKVSPGQAGPLCDSCDLEVSLLGKETCLLTFTETCLLTLIETCLLTFTETCLLTLTETCL